MSDTALGSETTKQAEGQPNEAGAPPSEGGVPEQQAVEESPKPEGAPESYEFKAPEGREFDSKVLEAYSNAAKELNLTQESAQKLLDAVGPVLHERGVLQQKEQIEAIRAQWIEQCQSDKEFGGNSFEDNIETAKESLRRLGSPELTQLLNESGLGDHPEVVRFFFRVGQAISEDGFVSGTPARISGPEDLSDPDVQVARLYKKS